MPYPSITSNTIYLLTALRLQNKSGMTIVENKMKHIRQFGSTTLRHFDPPIKVHKKSAHETMDTSTCKSIKTKVLKRKLRHLLTVIY